MVRTTPQHDASDEAARRPNHHNLTDQIAASGTSFSAAQPLFQKITNFTIHVYVSIEFCRRSKAHANRFCPSQNRSRKLNLQKKRKREQRQKTRKLLTVKVTVRRAALALRTARLPQTMTTKTWSWIEASNT